MSEPWKLQKTLEENEELLSEEEVIDKINGINSLRDRAFVSLLYLTAGRIGEVVRNRYHKDREGVRKKRIKSEVLDDNLFLIIKLRNEKSKRKDKKWKIIPINMRHQIDSQLANNVIMHMNQIDENEPLFTFGTCWGNLLVKKYMGFNPHWLRHIRLTHLTHNRNYNTLDLMKVAGWTDIRMASVYIMTRWQDIARKEMKL